MNQRTLFDVFNFEGDLLTKYFVLKNNSAPHSKRLTAKINSLKFYNAIKQNFEEKYSISLIKEEKFRTKDFSDGKSYLSGELNTFISLNDLIMIDTYENYSVILYHTTIEESEIQKILLIFKDAILEEDCSKSTFSMITIENNMLDLMNFDISKKEYDIITHYNKDLVDKTPDIISFLTSKDSSGLLLFNGIPGTGKTSYLRYLIQQCNARFIYLPLNLFNQLCNPNFLQFIGSYPNSILILEDSEELIRSRNISSTSSGISNLLNLGDGLLADAYRLKIICTFNCNINQIDSALLRKGRLFFKYEFEKLSVEQSNNLFKKLSIDKETSIPLSLAEIYGVDSDNNTASIEINKIGF